jgi:hypothetical protein
VGAPQDEDVFVCHLQTYLILRSAVRRVSKDAQCHAVPPHGRSVTPRRRIMPSGNGMKPSSFAVVPHSHLR